MKLRALLKNNKGAGIITVMVAVMFLTAFGSVLLMLSYTGFEMRTSDRKGKENLYDASSMMEQINAGIQQICSEAIVDSYGETLIRFNDYGSDITREFQVKYRDFISKCYFKEAETNLLTGERTEAKWTKATSVTNDANWIINNESKYNLSVLESMIVDTKGGTVTLASTSGCNVKNITTPIIVDETPKPIILEGVSVTYTKDDRTTTVTTDITINYPVIGYANNTYKDSGINENACIAQGKLIQNGGTPCWIYGGGYFGGIELKGSNTLVLSRLDTDNARFVIAGDTDITSDGYGSYPRLAVGKVLMHKEGTEVRPAVIDQQTVDGKTYYAYTDENLDYWTGNIKAHTGSDVAFYSNTYVADNLELAGTGASVALGGSYFGFGTENSDIGRQSSIISNARNTSLDISDLNRLSIAGYAFVGNSNLVRTAESISVKDNQISYLIPAEFIKYSYTYENTGGENVTVNDVEVKTNPEIMDASRFHSIQSWSLSDDPIWKNSDKTLADYGVTEPQVVVDVFPGSARYNVYLFVKFGDTLDDDGNLVKSAEENANRFFKDYFIHNPSEIGRYINNYVNLIGAATSTNTVGNGFKSEMVGSKKVISLSDYLSPSDAAALRSEAMDNADAYNRLVTNLNIGEINEDTEENPILNIVSSDLENIEGKYILYYKEDENNNPVAVGLASNKDIEIKIYNGQKIVKVDGETLQNVNPDNVSLIITTGNITIDGSGSSKGLTYNGLLMCYGDLELKNGAILNRDPTSVTEAYKAKSSDGSSITEFLESESEDEEKLGKAWIVTDLVGFDNWNRSSDGD